MKKITIIQRAGDPRPRRMFRPADSRARQEHRQQGQGADETPYIGECFNALAEEQRRRFEKFFHDMNTILN